MNKVVGSDQMMICLRDVHQIASIALRQLTDGPRTLYRSVSDLFLKDPFVLGYAIGFAEQASWHVNRGNGEEIGPDYLCDVIGAMLGNKSVAASFVAFAASKQGDRDFEGGYDAGLQDMDDWYLSYGENVPLGLLTHLQCKPLRT